MSKPDNNLINETLHPTPPKILHMGTCGCGCQEDITDQYGYSSYDGYCFVDSLHVVKYLKKLNLVEEVG